MFLYKAADVLVTLLAALVVVGAFIWLIEVLWEVILPAVGIFLMVAFVYRLLSGRRDEE